MIDKVKSSGCVDPTKRVHSFREGFKVSDNMSAGTMLGSFYGNQRVINGEDYFVVFVP